MLLLEFWEDFVEFCEYGYEWEWSEFWNEICS